MAVMGDDAHAVVAPRVLTFLFSDIEGSTRLVERVGARYAGALGVHHEILRDVITSHGGVVRKTEGDSFFATFDAATAAVTAAVVAQRSLAAHDWPDDCRLRVRMGLHTGEAALIGNELVGVEVHRAARIMSIGWGEQILVSSTTMRLLSGHADELTFRDLGSHRLKDLIDSEAIYQVLAPGLRTDFPPLRSVELVPNNLPVTLTSFVGRHREVGDVLSLLADNRILTLTGPGGTGKTRLSLRVATDVEANYAGGVFFVALASVTDPSLVVSKVASTLGLTPTGGRSPLDLVIDYLHSRRVLLVLDNFEQVLSAAVDVSKILAAAPEVSVLVTSRSALRISGEQEYPVPPLPLPGATDELADVAASEAATLFVTRAAAVRPGFALSAGNARSVAEIVRRLDGLPLAIELAAARMRLLPVEAIASRLGDALDLLSSGARDVPDRQRTLRGTIAWSYDLLDEPARRLFARCSIFRGGVEFDHLYEVCAPGLDDDVFETLSQLVDQSLLRRVDAVSGIRFAMLETIREFAAERLEASGEGHEIAARHAEAYLSLAEAAAPHLTAEDSTAWLDRLERDHDNLRAALRQATDGGDTRTALRLVSALWRMWQIRGHLHEGRRTVERTLALADVARYPGELAGAYEALGSIAYWQGDLPASREPYARALELYREAGNDEAVARAIYNLGFSDLDDPHRAVELFLAAITAYERLGDDVGVARSHWGLSVAYFWMGDYEAVLPHAERSRPVFLQTGKTFDLGWSLHIEASARMALGDIDGARAMFTDALDIFSVSGDASGLYLLLADFALLAEAEGDPARALRLFAAAARLGDETGAGLLKAEIDRYPRKRRAEDEVDAATEEALTAEGYAMTREEAVAYALRRSSTELGGPR